MTYCDNNNIPELSDSALQELTVTSEPVAFVVAFPEEGPPQLFRASGVTAKTPSFPIPTTEIRDLKSHASVSYTGSWCCSWISDGQITQFCRTHS